MRLNSKGFRTFYDIDSLGAGRFDTAIMEALMRSTHVIVLLTKDCLDRTANDGDWVRREIATALRMKKHIVPLVHYDFVFPEVASLPEDIRGLFLHHMQRWDYEYHSASEEKLLRNLEHWTPCETSHFDGAAGLHESRCSSDGHKDASAIVFNRKYSTYLCAECVQVLQEDPDFEVEWAACVDVADNVVLDTLDARRRGFGKLPMVDPRIANLVTIDATPPHALSTGPSYYLLPQLFESAEPLLVVGFVGPSGAGKSWLLSCIIALNAGPESDLAHAHFPRVGVPGSVTSTTSDVDAFKTAFPPRFTVRDLETERPESSLSPSCGGNAALGNGGPVATRTYHPLPAIVLDCEGSGGTIPSISVNAQHGADSISNISHAVASLRKVLSSDTSRRTSPHDDVQQLGYPATLAAARLAYATHAFPRMAYVMSDVLVFTYRGSTQERGTLIDLISAYGDVASARTVNISALPHLIIVFNLADDQRVMRTASARDAKVDGGDDDIDSTGDALVMLQIDDELKLALRSLFASVTVVEMPDVTRLPGLFMRKLHALRRTIRARLDRRLSERDRQVAASAPTKWVLLRRALTMLSFPESATTGPTAPLDIATLSLDTPNASTDLSQLLIAYFRMHCRDLAVLPPVERNAPILNDLTSAVALHDHATKALVERLPLAYRAWCERNGIPAGAAPTRMFSRALDAASAYINSRARCGAILSRADHRGGSEITCELTRRDHREFHVSSSRTNTVRLREPGVLAALGLQNSPPPQCKWHGEFSGPRMVDLTSTLCSALIALNDHTNAFDDCSNRDNHERDAARVHGRVGGSMVRPSRGVSADTYEVQQRDALHILREKGTLAGWRATARTVSLRSNFVCISCVTALPTVPVIPCGHALCERCALGALVSLHMCSAACPLCGASFYYDAAATKLPAGAAPRVLSLDGGGLRGVVAHAVLADVVARTGYATRDLFDLVVGTSAGATVAALTFGGDLVSPATVRRNLIALGERLFSPGSVSSLLAWLRQLITGTYYHGGHLLASIRAYLTHMSPRTAPGGAATLGSSESCGLLAADMPLFGAVNRLPHMAFVASCPQASASHLALFTSYNCEGVTTKATALTTGAADAKCEALATLPPRRALLHATVVEAVAASCAARPYFPDVVLDDESYADGCTACINPCEIAHQEASAVFPNQSAAVVLSIGTGSCKDIALLHSFNMYPALPQQRSFADLLTQSLINAIPQSELACISLRQRNRAAADAGRLPRLQPLLGVSSPAMTSLLQQHHSTDFESMLSATYAWLESQDGREATVAAADELLASMVFLAPLNNAPEHSLSVTVTAASTPGYERTGQLQHRSLVGTLRLRCDVVAPALRRQLKPSAFRALVDDKEVNIVWPRMEVDTWPANGPDELDAQLRLDGLPARGCVKLEVRVRWHCLNILPYRAYEDSATHVLTLSEADNEVDDRFDVVDRPIAGFPLWLR